MIVVLSQGCAANFGEGEKIARILSRKHDVCFEFPEITNNLKELEAFYLNVCTVKGNSAALKLLNKVYDFYPKTPIFITGCAPKDFKNEAIKIAPQIIFTSLHELENESNPYKLTLRESPNIGIVNIEEGCLDACAFCSTHLVKGRLRSFSSDYIIEQVKNFVKDGCKEIQLTGQDSACYGFDCNTNLAELVKKIVVKVSGDYKIRLGMGNPRHILKYKESLLECFTDNHLYKFIHLPVQSGSNYVLKAMNRKHSVEDYITLAESFKKNYEFFTLSTDIIVGHPGESENDFNQTIQLLKLTRPTICNITRFVARPNTVADKLEKQSQEYISVLDSIKHERSAILFNEFKQIALENNQQFIGKICNVVTEKQGHRDNTTIARNETYSPVAIQQKLPLGKKFNVKIIDAEPFALIAKVL